MPGKNQEPGIHSGFPCEWQGSSSKPSVAASQGMYEQKAIVRNRKQKSHPGSLMLDMKVSSAI